MDADLAWLGAPAIKKLALVTDAWKPQTNGVVNTLVRLVKHLESKGTEVLVVAPDAHRTVPLPSYPEIRIACDPWRAIARIRGVRARRDSRRHRGAAGVLDGGLAAPTGPALHDQLPHPLRRVPERARARVPLEWGYKLVRWFHGRAAAHAGELDVAAATSCRTRRVGQQLVHWPRGVDADALPPAHRRGDVYAGLPRADLALRRARGRREEPGGLPRAAARRAPRSWSATAPRARSCSASYPDVVWRGYRFGDDLSAHFASADCFVFPSRTETFGNVLLEAMASGLPVASVPAPGPVDLVNEGVNGAIDDDLARRLPARAPLLARARARQHRAAARCGRATSVFRAHLVPMQPGVRVRALGAASARARGRGRRRSGV